MIKSLVRAYHRNRNFQQVCNVFGIIIATMLLIAFTICFLALAPDHY